MNKKRILIIDASLRQGFVGKTVKQIENILVDLKVETIKLRDYNILRCKGCCTCLSVGNNKCPLKDDDVRIIQDKIESFDGIIFVTPNYSLNVPGILKDLFDRLAFVFHRPRLFNKVSLSIVVQGVYGGGKVAKYINTVMGFWGAKEVKGVTLYGGIYPLKETDKKISSKNDLKLLKALNRFNKELNNKKIPKPSIFKLMIFRMTRTSLKYSDESLKPDREYYEENGWFTSDYYYDVKLNLFKKTIGLFFDKLIKKQLKKQ